MKRIFGWLMALLLSAGLFAQKKLSVLIRPVPGEQRIRILVGDQPFTEFLYSDTMEKPVLFPIYAAGGELITRGFPRSPRPGEGTDHPHHIGLWLNYENVNGLDFWNNSYAIPEDKKSLYGWIRTDSLLRMISGKSASFEYSANWENQQKRKMVHEVTRFIFTADRSKRIIDRLTTLTALEDLFFPDSKDGMLGLRVARFLQIPSSEAQHYSDNKGNVTSLAPSMDSLENGNYLTSSNKTGNQAWGTRAVWCLLYGKIDSDSIGIAIIDHPRNPGYPTYWHARGYGLFAANPLGQKIFSNGKDSLNFKLKKGESVTFRYRIVIASGPRRISLGELNKLTSQFAKE
jgi:hypothetical protein